MFWYTCLDKGMFNPFVWLWMKWGELILFSTLSMLVISIKQIDSFNSVPLCNTFFEEPPNLACALSLSVWTISVIFFVLREAQNVYLINIQITDRVENWPSVKDSIGSFRSIKTTALAVSEHNWAYFTTHTFVFWKLNQCLMYLFTLAFGPFH